MKDFVPEFRLKSVLNTDGYDKDTYAELRKASSVLKNTEAEGSKTYTAFPHLLGDTWAGLFKNTPAVCPDAPKGMESNQAVMGHVLEHREFQSLREFTRLDEMASALGAIQLSDRLSEIIKDTGAAKLQNQANKAQEKAEAAQAIAETLKEMAEMTGSAEKKQELLRQAKNKLQVARRAEKKADRLGEKAKEAVQKKLDSTAGKEALSEALAQSASQTIEDKKEIDSLLSSMGYGTGPRERMCVPAKDRLALAEALKSRPKLKITANYLGRMQKIALEKQKSRSDQSIVKNDVDLGNSPADILPSELALLKHPNGRKLFMKKFIQGELLQYSPKGKEKLGKGPIVCCLDTSGSMSSLDEQSKAFMLALLMIAQKQKRAFACINYASKTELRSWLFGKLERIAPSDLSELAQFFWSGGTDFEAPLDQAIKIIEQSAELKRADIVFITDGYCAVGEDWQKRFLEQKSALEVNMVAILIGGRSRSETLEALADKVVLAEDFFAESAADAAFTI